MPGSTATSAPIDPPSGSIRSIFRLNTNILPGVLLSVTIALAAMFISGQYGGPVMLYALGIGIAFNFISEEKRFESGITFSAKKILRIGVALLGLRVTLGEIASLGLPTLTLVSLGLVTTILFGWLIGKALGLRSDHAILSAGAVAICGASAALAIAAALPRHKDSECNTILTVVGVTALSTVAMVFYPFIAGAMGFSDELAGIFIGATIHDVAQVVGAGYTISESAGDTAAIVKLMRVTYLAPVVFFVALAFRQNAASETGARVPIVPFFMLAFLAFVALNSANLIPAGLVTFGSEVSRFALITAVAALGCKTSIKTMIEVGPKPMLVLSAITLLLAGFALTGLHLFFS